VASATYSPRSASRRPLWFSSALFFCLSASWGPRSLRSQGRPSAGGSLCPLRVQVMGRYSRYSHHLRAMRGVSQNLLCCARLASRSATPICRNVRTCSGSAHGYAVSCATHAIFVPASHLLSGMKIDVLHYSKQCCFLRACVRASCFPLRANPTSRAANCG